MTEGKTALMEEKEVVSQQVDNAPKRFLVGVKKDAPFQYTVCGDSTFSLHFAKFINKIQANEDDPMQPRQYRKYGQVVELTKDQHKRLLEAIAIKVVRFVNKEFEKYQGFHNVKSPTYFKSPLDKPLSDFLFVKHTEDLIDEAYAFQDITPKPPELGKDEDEDEDKDDGKF